MATDDNPYGDLAKIYYDLGWNPLLLPPGAKVHPPRNYTGFGGREPSYPDVQAWIDESESKGGNIALRFPRGVIGIDIDHYGDKTGGDTLEKLTADYGELDLSSTWRITSRADDGTISGIYLFRMPDWLAWPGEAGPNIELIHWGHRYAVAPGSIHPEGRTYRLYAPGGAEVGVEDMPRPGDLPELPDAWISGLTGGVEEIERAKVETSLSQAVAWLESLPEFGTSVCKEQAAIYSRWAAREGSAHAAMVKAVQNAVYASAEGHRGGRAVIGLIMRQFLDEVDNHGRRKPGEAAREWGRSLAGAVGNAKGKGEPATQGCDCGGEQMEAWLADNANTGPEDLPAAEAEFWESRAVLAYIRRFALSRMVSPWAVFGVCVLRVLHKIPPDWRLPGWVGPPGSLNLFVALCGASGSGKTAAAGVAAEVFTFKPSLGSTDPEPIIERVIGSGEGLSRAYLERGNGNRLTGKMKHTAILWQADEVGQVAAIKDRNGSTLLTQLRTAFSGATLGFTNADPTRDGTLTAHSYRLGAFIGVQDVAGDALLCEYEAGLGTPQRFIWMSATDPAISRNRPALPEPWELDMRLHDGPQIIPLPVEAEELVLDAAEKRGNGLAGLNAHAVFAREKVAVALAFMDGREEVSLEDWELSETVMRVSDRTRARVQAATAKAESTGNVKRGKAQGEREDAAEEAKAARAVQRVSTGVLSKIAKFGPDGVRRSQLRKAFASYDRGYVDRALEALIEVGQVEEFTEPGQGAEKHILRRAEQ